MKKKLILVLGLMWVSAAGLTFIEVFLGAEHRHGWIVFVIMNFMLALDALRNDTD